VGEFAVEWSEPAGMQYRFFANREEAAQFVGSLAVTATSRRSNLEDVFVELTGRKVVG
jgi:ABC-2 type transport system ATP-binding protein